ncbi:MAG: hypothetical protein HY344_00280 [Candidatus Levybacteria bacterium]|nr:hypothetical protein [Candidatus Levybacteria bacterium]
MKLRLQNILKLHFVEIVILIGALIFSSWLMFSSFSYSGSSMMIGSKAWSDFSSHIPLIRSFSIGDNLPPQYPLFSGPAIKYHFLFYLLVGFLEKIGLRIDLALNIPSIFGFTLLILMIYFFAKEIFKSKAVGVLSVILFLFNSTLSFVNYFAKNGLSLDSIYAVLTSTKFASFGPYDNSIVSAFWNLNIYTNQRHVALSYALSLLIIYLILKFNEHTKHKNFEKTFLIAIVFGLSFLLNIAVFLMTALVLACMLIFLKEKRIYIFLVLLIGGIIALPQYLFLSQVPSESAIAINPGYLVENLNLVSFVNYWFYNLGFNIFLIPLGFFLTNKLNKKILISFVSLFIVANLIQFSPEIAANHKFFNFSIIVGGMFSAFALYILWKKRNIFKPLVVVLFFFLTLSGIIDFFPILNDSKITLSDYPKNKNISWIMENTSKNAVFLNNQYLYNYASLAGRKIFLGWPYFAWSQGYNTQKRDDIRKKLLNTSDLEYFCKQSLNFHLNYVDINLNNEDAVVNKSFFDKNFKKVFENTKDGFIIYNINSKC